MRKEYNTLKGKSGIIRVCKHQEWKKASVSEGRMLPRKALRRSGPELDSGSFDAEFYHQKTCFTKQ